MRVVAGQARGVRLSAPPGTDTRPTSDRVREAIFNVLFSLGGIDDLVVVDLFAGSGALGIEAMSRGARSATFVERDPRAASTIRDNLAATGLDGDVVVGDAGRWTGRADVAFVDPPYAFDGWEELLRTLTVELVVIESDRAVDVGDAWLNVRQKRYGGTVVTFARRPPPQPSGEPA